MKATNWKLYRCTQTSPWGRIGDPGEDFYLEHKTKKMKHRGHTFQLAYIWGQQRGTIKHSPGWEVLAFGVMNLIPCSPLEFMITTGRNFYKTVEVVEEFGEAVLEALDLKHS